MANEPGGLDELHALGPRTVPVLAWGDDYVFGQSIRDVSQFLGLDDAGDGPLPPEELYQRMDLVLAAAARYLRQIPDDRIDDKLPNRDRSYRELGYHVFVVIDCFLDVTKGRVLRSERFDERPPSDLRHGPEIADYGETIRSQLADWWTSQQADFSRQVPTYYGDQSLHDVMERGTWHAAQHVRQLMMVLEELGLAPDGPLTPADLADLPLPDQVWDG